MTDVFASANLFLRFLYFLGFFPFKRDKGSFKLCFLGVFFTMCNYLVMGVLLYCNFKNNLLFRSSSVLMTFGWILIAFYTIFALIFMLSYQLWKYNSVEDFFIGLHSFDEAVRKVTVL
jgi:hypothetical protein